MCNGDAYYWTTMLLMLSGGLWFAVLILDARWRIKKRKNDDLANRIEKRSRKRV